MNKRIPILLGFILLAVAVWLQITTVGIFKHFINRLEDLAYDVQLRTKLLTHPTPFQSSVAIVDIDDQSVAKEGRWPWPRSKLAALTTRLQEAGAVVIVFDMFFAAKENNVVDEVVQSLQKNQLLNPQLTDLFKKIEPQFDNDAIFANTLKQSDTEIGMSFLPRQAVSGILPQPALAITPAIKDLDIIIAKGYIGDIPILQSAVKSTGFVNVFGDEDGIIRRVPLLIRYENNLYPSLALEAVRLYLLSKIDLVTAIYDAAVRLEGVRVANHVIPTDEQAQVYIPFRGKSYTFPFYSATDVLNKKFHPEAFQGKIVFVGTSATGLGDIKATAIESAFPGVEIQATIADGILSDNFSYKPPWALGAEIFLTVILGILLAWFFPYLGPRLLSLMIVLIPTILMSVNNELWEKTGLILSVFIPSALAVILALVNMIYGYLFETRRREHLKEMFGQYVPSKHIDEMLTSAGSAGFGMYGEDREMTVLFADVRNFTTISENLTATQLKELLNAFFTPMTEIIFKHRGTIDKYVGDLIMAFWGAPLKDKRHAQHAISAAIDMQKKLKELRSTLAQGNGHEIHIGIGLNSGIMSVGDMGSKFRRNYTVLGDAVNLASRVENLTKHYGVNILVTEFTEAKQSQFIFRQVDRVRVKGKEKEIAVYEVIGRKSEMTPELEKEMTLSHLALQCYFNKEWDKAQEIFMQLHAEHPEVKFYKVYLDRLNDFKQNPPANWDGVYVMPSK